MGLLTTGGPPMRWGARANDLAIPYIREHGITQFLNIYRKYEKLDGKPFLWGDEIEAIIVDLPEDGKTVRLSLTAADLLAEANASVTDSKFLPEFGSFMIESTPAEPYSLAKASVLSVEACMQRRYDLLRLLLSKKGDHRAVVTLVAFPLLGTTDFIAQPEGGKELATRGEFCASIFVPDEVANMTHPRFLTLARNIRLRRGRKVCIQVPMFIDTHTLERSVDPLFRIDKHPANNLIDCAPLQDAKTHAFDDDDEASPTSPATSNGSDTHAFTHLYTPATHYYYGQYDPTDDRPENVKKRYEACPCPIPSVTHPCVYMDAMAFGMGMCCLQVTMQMPNVAVARHTFDQLAAICPVFLALTAATPIQKGFLVDSDVRWLTIAASVDDRKRSEVPQIIKSRYDSISLYMSPRPENLEKWNDNHVEVDAAVLERLRKEGIDERMARHVSHLFIRDPLVIYEGRVEELDDQHNTDHFENVQSTNWQTIRFKPPPFDTDIGWRVEFRVMEIQMSPFENAAFSVFVVLLTRAIMKYDLWLYLPMSKIDENMGRAHMRDAVKAKYWFPKSTTPGHPDQGVPIELTANEIFNGSAAFEGYVPLVRRLIAEEGLTDPRLEQYLTLVSQRASGKLQTTAAFLRDFVRSHSDYKQDSRVTPQIARDIVDLASNLALGTVAFENFLPAALVSQPAASPRKRSQRDE